MPTQMPRNGAPRAQHCVPQRRDHAIDGGKPVHAIAERADTGQHDALRIRDSFGIGRDDDLLPRRALPRPRAPALSPQSADCPSHNR